jgi:hypothetical protein
VKLNEPERQRSGFAQVGLRILASYGSQVIRKEMQMKRHTTFMIVASLLASASAFAAGNPYGARERNEKLAVQNQRVERGHDNRDHDNRGREDRGRAQRDDHRNDRRDNYHRDNDRRDWNDHNRNDRHGDRDDRQRREWIEHHRNDRPARNGHDWNGRNDRNDRWDRNDRNDRWDRYRNDWNRHPHYNDNRRYDRRDYARYRYDFGRYHPPRGYHYRAWYLGDRLPRSYYGSSYIVYDWRPYRLYEPPYGYHWVRVGSDVVLTAIATGIVLDVLYDIWY